MKTPNMNLGFIANSSLAIPTLQYLIANSQIKALALPDQLNPDTEHISLLANQYKLETTFLNKDLLDQQLSTWIETNQLDVILVFTFPWKISAHCLQMPKHGVYNVHFAPLPEYRGGAPLFWLIKNREKEGGLCIHEMTTEVDTGAIAFQTKVPLTSEETLGNHMAKLSNTAVSCTQNFLAQLKADTLTSKEQNSVKAKYWPNPQSADFIINWSKQTVSEIKALVKASNPHYGGAITYYQNFPLRILEVTTADSRMLQQTFPPGTILNVKNEANLFVTCKGGGLLRIEVIKLEEGYFSGWKLFEMGVRPGTTFTSPTS